MQWYDHRTFHFIIWKSMARIPVMVAPALLFQYGRAGGGGAAGVEAGLFDGLDRG